MPCNMYEGVTGEEIVRELELSKLSDRLKALEKAGGIKSAEEVMQEHTTRLADMLCWVIRKIPGPQRRFLRKDIAEWWITHETVDDMKRGGDGQIIGHLYEEDPKDNVPRKVP